MKRLCLRLLIASLCICALPAWSVAQEDRNPLAPLSKGDGLLIHIENVGGGIPKYREVIDTDGNIKLPFLGLLSAVGKTTGLLSSEMAEAYATARLATNATVQITVVTHFTPPPDRENLVRGDDPRRPIPIEDTPLLIDPE